MKPVAWFCTFGITVAALWAARAEEPDDTRIINHVLGARDEIQAIVAKRPQTLASLMASEGVLEIHKKSL